MRGFESVAVMTKPMADGGELDLGPVVHVVGWVNIYEHPVPTPRCLFDSREQADHWADALEGNRRLACVRVEGWSGPRS